MVKLFPERLGIEKGLDSDLAMRVVDRIKAGNSACKITADYQKGVTKLINLPDTPRKSIAQELWKANKRSMVLRNKQKDHTRTNLRFLHVFLSVEKAREGYQFAFSAENECPYSCTYCYLQATLKESPIPTIYANFQDDGVLIRGIKIGLLGMHMYTQVHGVQENIGRDGQARVHQIIKILEKSIPEAKLNQPLSEIFKKYKSDIHVNLKSSGLELLKPIIDHFDKFDFTNITRTFHFNHGDLNDGMANDHLTENSSFLVGIFNNEIMKKDGGQLLIRTKSVNIENLKKVEPNDNVVYYTTVGTNTFSKGVPHFKDRIKAARELQELGYRIRISLDPIIQYSDTVKQYIPILDEVRDVMDIANPNFERITLGMLRFSDGNINEVIRDRHPDLFGHSKRSEMKKHGDEEKLRYDRQFRVDTYQALKDHAQEIMPGVSVKLSTEAISVWEDVGLSWEKT
jgi:DNA repair photolyase